MSQSCVPYTEFAQLALYSILISYNIFLLVVFHIERKGKFFSHKKDPSCYDNARNHLVYY